jgi:hypothetical protein
MKKTITITGILALSADSASAAISYIDLGISSQTTTGNYNNMTGGTGAVPNNLANMIDNTGATTDIGVEYVGNNITLAGTAGTGANFDVPGDGPSYPTVLSGISSSALRDGLFINENGVITLTFTGLDAGMTYDFLAYGARGNGGVGVTYTATGANTENGSISSVSDNGTETVNLTGITANGSNEITFVVTDLGGAGALNFLQITSSPIPEPSSTALLGLGGLALILRRRK